MEETIERHWPCTRNLKQSRGESPVCTMLRRFDVRNHLDENVDEIVGDSGQNSDWQNRSDWVYWQCGVEQSGSSLGS